MIFLLIQALENDHFRKPARVAYHRLVLWLGISLIALSRADEKNTREDESSTSFISSLEMADYVV